MTAYKRKTPLTITFCDPNIVQVGQSHESLDPDQTVVGQVEMAPVGRALIMAKNKGLIRVYADRKTGLVRDREEIVYEDKHKQRRFTRQLKDRVVQAILTPGIREDMVGRGLNITRVRTKQRTRAILGLKMC